MYNHILEYIDSEGSIKVIVEDSPNVDEGLLVWELEFGKSSDRRSLIVERFQVWAKNEGLEYTIRWNSSRV
jgi:hypothetical protein